MIATLLVKVTKCKLCDIYFTLKKIRTNLSFEYLVDNFGISTRQDAKVFKKNFAIDKLLHKKLYFLAQKKDKIKKYYH